MGQGDCRKPEEEGEVKGKAADSTAHLLNDTAGTQHCGSKGGDTCIYHNTFTIGLNVHNTNRTRVLV